MLITGEKGRSNDIIYRRSYNCGDDQPTGWLGGPDSEVTHTWPNCTPSVERVHPVYKRRPGLGGPSRRKRPEVVVEKPDKPLPLETLFVRTGARGRLLAETQNRFSQNPWPSPSYPLFIYPLSLRPLFSSSFPGREGHTIVLFLSFSLSLFLSSFSSSPFYSWVYVRVHACVIQRDRIASLWRAFKLTGPESHARGLPHD